MIVQIQFRGSTASTIQDQQIGTSDLRIRIRIRTHEKRDGFRFSWIRIRGAWIRIRGAWIRTSLIGTIQSFFQSDPLSSPPMIIDWISSPRTQFVKGPPGYLSTSRMSDKEEGITHPSCTMDQT